MRTDRRPRRSQGLPLRLVDPCRVEPHDGPSPNWPTRRSNALIAETGFQQFHLLAGSAALKEASSNRRLLRAFVVPALTAQLRRAFDEALATTGTTPGTFVRLVPVLFELGLSTTNIATILPLTASEVSRLRRAATIPSLADALASARLRFAEARRLLAMPTSELDAEIAIAKQRGKRRLKEARAAKSQRANSDANLAHEEALLSEALSTAVRIQSSGQGGEIAIDWATAGDLLSVLERIGRGPNPHAGLPNRGRTLRIEFASLDEYEAILGHVVRQPE